MEDLKKIIENLKKIFSKLKLFSERGIPILVEGRQDLQSLKQMDIKNSVVTLKGRRMFEIADDLSKNKEIIILTDFDKTGKKLAYDLKKEFEMRGVSPNLVYWKKLKSYLKRYSKDIESIAKIIENIGGI